MPPPSLPKRTLLLYHETGRLEQDDPWWLSFCPVAGWMPRGHVYHSTYSPAQMASPTVLVCAYVHAHMCMSVSWGRAGGHACLRIANARPERWTSFFWSRRRDWEEAFRSLYYGLVSRISSMSHGEREGRDVDYEGFYLQCPRFTVHWNVQREALAAHGGERYVVIGLCSSCANVRYCTRAIRTGNSTKDSLPFRRALPPEQHAWQRNVAMLTSLLLRQQCMLISCEAKERLCTAVPQLSLRRGGLTHTAGCRFP